MYVTVTYQLPIGYDATPLLTHEYAIAGSWTNVFNTCRDLEERLEKQLIQIWKLEQKINELNKVTNEKHST